MASFIQPEEGHFLLDFGHKNGDVSLIMKSVFCVLILCCAQLSLHAQAPEAKDAGKDAGKDAAAGAQAGIASGVDGGQAPRRRHHAAARHRQAGAGSARDERPHVAARCDEA